MKSSLVVTLALLAVVSGCSRTGDPAEELARARESMAAGKSGEARVRLKNALAKDSGLAEARLLLAQIALDDGNANAAEAELSSLGPTRAATAAGAALGVRVALARNDLELAGKRLDEGTAVLSAREQALLRADLLRRRNEGAEALRVLREALQAEPGAEDIGIEIAETLAATGNLQSAVGELERFIAGNSPYKPTALRLRAELRLRQGSPKLAIDDLKQLLDSAPSAWPRSERITAELTLVNAMLAAGQTPEAREQLKHINETWPGLIGAEVLGAQIDMIDGRFGEAVERLSPIAESAPENQRMQLLLVDALVKSGNTERATSILQELLSKDRSNTVARQILAGLWMQNGQPDRVVKLLSESGETDSRALSVESELLATARQTQQRGLAELAKLEARLKAAPDDRSLVAQTAYTRIMNGDTEGGIALLGRKHEGDWMAEEAAARMSAHLVAGNDLEVNKLVDELLSAAPAPAAEVFVAAADVAHRYQRPAAASRLLDRAAKLQPDNSVIAMRRATLAFDGKRYEEAENLLKAVSASDRNAAQVAVALARIAEARGDIASARAQLQAAVSKYPDIQEYALMLASLELRANRPAEANAVLDALLARAKDGTAANKAGQLLLRQGRLEEARSRLRQAIEKEPGKAAYWYNLGQAQLALADRGAAQESFIRSHELQPDLLDAAVAAVRISLEQNDTAAAIRVAVASTRALPDSSTSWLMRGGSELAGGQPAAARDSFARAWTLRPGSEAAVGEFRARLQSKAQRPDAPLIKWLDRQPGDTAVRGLLADYYLVNGQPVAAVAQLEIMVKDSPNDAMTLNNLAWLLNDKQPDRAEKYAAQAFALAPDNAAVGDTLGMVLSGRGKHEQAEPVLARAASIAPENPTIQYHYALVLHKAGKTGPARAQLQRVLQDGKNFEGRAEALRLLKEIDQ